MCLPRPLITPMTSLTMFLSSYDETSIGFDDPPYPRKSTAITLGRKEKEKKNRLKTNKKNMLLLIMISR